jgi:CheY-like chemotaxis protein
MARKKIEDEDEDFEDFDEEILEEESNESNVESALAPRDYSQRKVLLLELDDAHRPLTIEMLQEMLTGATIKAARTVEEGLKLMDEAEWDTYVVDLQEPGVSVSDFVKQVNNLADTILVSIPFHTIQAGEVRNRFKLEPLRKLFEIEKPAPPKA